MSDSLRVMYLSRHLSPSSEVARRKTISFYMLDLSHGIEISAEENLCHNSEYWFYDPDTCLSTTRFSEVGFCSLQWHQCCATRGYFLSLGEIVQTHHWTSGSFAGEWKDVAMLMNAVVSLPLISTALSPISGGLRSLYFFMNFQGLRLARKGWLTTFL